MKVTVRYFARLRETAGREKAVVDLEDSSPTLGELLARLGEGNDAVRSFLAERPVLLAVNGEYADSTQSLQDGDEVALFPPVSGG